MMTRPVVSIEMFIAVLLSVLLLGGCATEGQSDIGKLGGAATGAALGSLIGSGRGKTLAMVGGALLGGYAGDKYYDKPREEDYREQQAATRRAEYDDKLAYERQRQLQQARVERVIQQQRMQEQWQHERTGQGASMSSDEVSKAQRLLRGLGFYNGKVDGVVGSGTTDAVKAYQREYSLAVNGLITPALISDMQARM